MYDLYGQMDNSTMNAPVTSVNRPGDDECMRGEDCEWCASRANQFGNPEKGLCFRGLASAWIVDTARCYFARSFKARLTAMAAKPNVAPPTWKIGLGTG
jgi:hypothetical protein